MGMNLYVGNLAYDITDVDLREAFAPLGNIVSTKIIIDKHTGQSRGFGFVEFANREEGEAAITSMQGKPIRNRNVTVNEARPPEARQPGQNDRRNNYNNNRNRNQSYAPRRNNDDNHGNRVQESPMYQQSVERTYN